MMVLGVDVGGSAIKADLVDVDAGRPAGRLLEVATPRPATPAAVAEAVGEVVGRFGWDGPVGCSLPAVVRRGVAHTAANIDPAWIGTDAEAVFSEATGLAVTVVNDADAAGIAETAHGAARGRSGVVLVLTFGTGIGSALFVDGTLVPNTELGHLELDGHVPVEAWAAARVRTDEGLSWETWAGRVDRLLRHLVALFSPELIVVGGGVSRRWDRFGHLLRTGVETVPAFFGNQAGVVGAAMAARR